ncbi:uncharacterized protein LOC120292101 [Eucalyptus grandis]|uniref:uncharacterized protein LOC120292101 n=1 Tax=Eucalyptus grandis TaxID=71139 RepID=UPI00192EA3E1|nr:uncharacterized protein LOC120292101 [Eucalyptus grandis]
MMGQQAQNQAAATATATATVNVVAAVAAAPTEVQLGKVIRERPMHKCSEEDKVVLAVYQLQGNASTWWEATRGRVFSKGTIPVWNAFVEVFNGKYFSDCTREQKMTEFQRLCQGLMSMDQYNAKFTELSKYAPRLIDDPVDRARRFQDGLRSEIKDPLVPLNLKDYNDLYERAQLIERNLNERAAASGSRFGSCRDGNRLGKKLMSGG